MEKENQQKLPTTAGLNVLCEDLQTLIDNYKVRQAKIEKAANRIHFTYEERAYKAGAANSTKQFIKDLRKLQKTCLWHISIEE